MSRHDGELCARCLKCDCGFGAEYVSPAETVDVLSQLLAHGPRIGPHLIWGRIEAIAVGCPTPAVFYHFLWGYLGELDFEADREGC